MPGEIQDQVLEEVLCDFPRPPTSKMAKDGRYIGEHSSMALIPWDVDLNILDHPDPTVVARARRAMLTNQLVYIKSESVNLRPMFHAARVPILDMRYPITKTEVPVSVVSDYFVLTHQIERLGGAGSSITSTERPWGRTREQLEKLDLLVHGRPKLQEYVILGRDLPLFCEALNGADSGYYHFGEYTYHRLTIHGPFDKILGRRVPILESESILKPYLSTVRGFEHFDIQGNGRWDTAEKIKKDVGKEIATPRTEEIVEDLKRQMSKGDELLSLGKPVQAAHTYARASQGLVWLFSRGMLPDRPFALAHLFFMLGLREADAWLAEMERRTRNDTPVGRDGDCDDQSSYSTLRELVRNTIIRHTPPPLRYDPYMPQKAIQLYHLAKADRLMDSGDKSSWSNINKALRMAPQDARIRKEAEIINSRMTPWLLQWVPEKR